MKTEKHMVEPKLPPYVSYVTFRNFIDQMHSQIVPKQIDRTVLPTMGGGQFSQLMHALRYFGLVDENGETNDTLESLAKSEGVDRKNILGGLLLSSYGSLLHSKGKGIDLTKETKKSLLDKFMSTGTTLLVANRCLLFFLNMAVEAGLPIPDTIKPQSRVRKSGKSRADRKEKTRDKETDFKFPPKTPIEPQLTGELAIIKDLTDQLNKIPDGWTIEQRLQWAKAITEMIQAVRGDSIQGRKNGEAKP